MTTSALGTLAGRSPGGSSRVIHASRCPAGVMSPDDEPRRGE